MKNRSETCRSRHSAGYAEVSLGVEGAVRSPPLSRFILEEVSTLNRTFDRYASIVFLLLGIGFMWQSAKISSSAYGSTVGPNIFPFGLGLALVFAEHSFVL